MKSNNSKILIVEQSSGIKKDLIDFFTELGLDCLESESLPDFKEKFQSQDIAIALVDSDCVEICSREVLEEIKEMNDSVYIVIMLTELSAENLVFVINNADNFVNKPFSFHNLSQVIERGLKYHERTKHYHDLREFEVVFQEWKKAEQTSS